MRNTQKKGLFRVFDIFQMTPISKTTADKHIDQTWIISDVV